MSALGQKQTCAARKPMSAKCQRRTIRRPIHQAILENTFTIVGVTRFTGSQISSAIQMIVIKSPEARATDGLYLRNISQSPVLPLRRY